MTDAEREVMEEWFTAAAESLLMFECRWCGNITAWLETSESPSQCAHCGAWMSH